MPVMMGLLVGFAVCGLCYAVCYAFAAMDHERELVSYERWLRNKKALTERSGLAEYPQMVLTPADIAALASRMRGHAGLLPRSSERADMILAAAVLTAMEAGLQHEVGQYE